MASNIMNTFAQQQRNDRSKAAAQAKATQTSRHEAAHVGPHAESQLRLGQLLGGGPRAAAQLRLAQIVTQRQAVDEDELVQRDKVTDEEEAAQFQTDEEDLVQRQTAPEEDESVQLKSRGGLPANLKSGLEGLSGVTLDDVKVHYNSPKPSQLHAHAYTQGSEIHVAPGQEQHLPHEAWHAVQQKQGRVHATTQLQGVSINDDHALEREADVMGAKALQMKPGPLATTRPATVSSAETHGPVQMLQEIRLPEKDYGLGWSREAMKKRVQDNIPPQLNIATFHFVPRPPLDRVGEPVGERFTITKSSTGIGTYLTVREGTQERTEARRKINASHSEHLIRKAVVPEALIPQELIQEEEGEVEQLHEHQGFPEQNIIDWVYTERPACPDVWYGPNRIARGCKTELETLERIQKTRIWDVGPLGPEPYGPRDNLGITVFSTFDSAADIRTATAFAPIRREIYRFLYRELTRLLDDEEAAKEAANQLPSWSAYEGKWGLKWQQQFRRTLLDASHSIYNWILDALSERATVYQDLVRKLTGLYEPHPDVLGNEDAEDRAKEQADELATWQDYRFSFDDAGLKEFSEALRVDENHILEKESRIFPIPEEPVPMSM